MSWDAIWTVVTPQVIGYAGQIVLVLVVLLVGWIAAGWVGMAVSKGISRAGLDETLSRFLGKAARWLVLILLLFAYLAIP